MLKNGRYMKLTVYDKLDYVLNYIKELKHEQTTDITILSYTINNEYISTEEVFDIVNKLIKNGYVDEINKNNIINIQINLEGRIFISTGGYNNQHKIDKYLKTLEKTKTILLVGGTASAGIYGIFEVLKWLFHHEGWRLLF